MRRFGCNASRARKHCQARRSLVNPNDGFWRSLCAFEQVLGITDRSACSPLMDGRNQYLTEAMQESMRHLVQYGLSVTYGYICCLACFQPSSGLNQ